MPRRDVPDALSAAIGRRIRALREEQGLTLEKLAYESALGSKGHLSDIERGLVRPTIQTLQVLAERLAVRIYDLLTHPEDGGRDALVDATRRMEPPAIEELLHAANVLRVAPSAGLPMAPFRTVDPGPPGSNPRGIPLMDLAIAAGGFNLARTVTTRAWVMPRTGRRLRDGMFVAQVIGRSMEPEIPDGAWCLFDAPVRGDLQGRVLLVQHRAIHDADTGASCTVKRFDGDAEVSATGTRTWRRIRLQPINPDFAPILLDARDADDLRVVAELVTVLPES